MTRITVEIYTGECDLCSWDPNFISVSDYETARARRLYEALGASPDDEEYALAAHADGRWALFGLTVEGHEYAVEDLNKDFS